MTGALKAVSRFCSGILLAAAFAIAGAGAASAQVTANFTTITNNFGSTITLDTASCSPSGSISPTFSIANGSTGSASGTSSNSSMTCTVRYQNGSNGCQFQIQVSTFSSGIATANAYKGSGGRPTCTVDTQGQGTNEYHATFTMK